MSKSTTLHSPRWQNYVMDSGCQLMSSWRTHFLAERHVLFVLGRGFDPRMCLGLRSLLGAGGTGKRDIMALDFDEGASSPSKEYEPIVRSNWTQLQELAQERGSLSTKTLKMWTDDGRRIGSRSALELFSSLNDFSSCTDIIVDISALPRGIYIPLVARILYLLDEEEADGGGRKPNLHIVVAENSMLDRCIQDVGIDETATYLHPFAGGLEREATADHPKVWIPVLGEAQATQLSRIYDLVVPDEIAPLLPFPSLNPRRADDLLLEYRELLFDKFRVEPSNFILGSERNPFEVYRQIRKAVLHYRSALLPLGGCKAVLSALSTKLLSVGALLVAYELKQLGVDIGIADVECQGYNFEQPTEGDESETQSELFALWISGECYET